MDWEFKPRSEVCCDTGRPFQDKEVYFTVLKQGAEGLLREDLCQEAWGNRYKDPEVISFWRSTFQPRAEEEETTVDPTDAESVLRHLLDAKEPGHEKTCCLLALLLERKRILKVRERTEIQSNQVVIYEHVPSQETLAVPDVDFQLSELAELVNQLEASRDIEAFGRQHREPEPPSA